MWLMVETDRSRPGSGRVAGPHGGCDARGHRGSWDRSAVEPGRPRGPTWAFRHAEPRRAPDAASSGREGTSSARARVRKLGCSHVA